MLSATSLARRYWHYWVLQPPKFFELWKFRVIPQSSENCQVIIKLVKVCLDEMKSVKLFLPSFEAHEAHYDSAPDWKAPGLVVALHESSVRVHFDVGLTLDSF